MCIIDYEKIMLAGYRDSVAARYGPERAERLYGWMAGRLDRRRARIANFFPNAAAYIQNPAAVVNVGRRYRPTQSDILRAAYSRGLTPNLKGNPMAKAIDPTFADPSA